MLTQSDSDGKRGKWIAKIKGYDILNHNVNRFPTSIAQLNQIAFKLRPHKPESKLWLSWLDFKSKGYVDTAFTVAAVVGIIALWSNLFWWSLLVAYFTCNISTITNHEGWGHRYIVAKNNYYEAFWDMFAHMCWFHYTDKRPLAYIKSTYGIGHGAHHRLWQDPEDLDTQSGKRSWAKHTWFISLADIAHSKMSAAFYKIDIIIDQRVDKLPKWQQFVERQSLWIMLAIHLAFLAAFGFTAWFYFMFLQMVYVRTYITLLTDIIPHAGVGNDPKKELWWTWPLFLDNSYHIRHHTTGYYLGPKWTNPFNIQWWFIKMFYNETAKVSAKPMKWTGLN